MHSFVYMEETGLLTNCVCVWIHLGSFFLLFSPVLLILLFNIAVAAVRVVHDALILFCRILSLKKYVCSINVSLLQMMVYNIG